MRELRRFSLVSVLEEGIFEKQLSDFLARDFLCPRDNVTNHKSSQGADCDTHIGKNALDLLESRTRMDRSLWRASYSLIMPEPVRDRIERKTIMYSLATIA